LVGNEQLAIGNGWALIADCSLFYGYLQLEMRLLWAYLIVGALLLGGLIVSALYAPVWYDDAGHFLVAREVARGHGMCYPVASEEAACISDSPFITMGPVQAYPLGWWMRCLGESMLSGRLFMILLSLGTAFALFRLGKALTSSAKALIAVGLLAVNIQFITYGAEVLGEVPMMGLILGGLGFLLRWERGGASWNAGVGLIFWCLAVGIKEYAMLPTGLSLVIWLLIRLISREKPLKIFALGIAYALALVLTLALIHGVHVLAYLQARQSYGSEFLAFNLGLSLKFLLFKPLFWLGMGAMVLKWRVKQRGADALILSVQAAWLVFFLLSAGYDRFGFLLLFLPAIYVAEFVPYLWQEAARKREWAWPKRIGLIVIGLVVFAQQTYWVFGKRMLQPELVNGAERAAAAWVEGYYGQAIFTMDQQLIPFLSEGQAWGLTGYVPSQKDDFALPRYFFHLPAHTTFAAGPYAFTEYQNRIDWAAMQAIDSVEVAGEKWVFYESREQ
jgi:Dolichyl-phosphate-mannose-protein mannosyltransferase